MTEPNDVERNKALTEFREKNFKELKGCLKVSIEIRDNPEESARDRNAAIRNIAALLGAMTERGDVLTKGKPKARVIEPEPPDSMQDELEKLLLELQ